MPKAVAHRGVGGGAAALAEDAVRSRELHHVVDGEEVGLVVQFGDERELAIDKLAHARDFAGGVRRGRTGDEKRLPLPTSLLPVLRRPATREAPGETPLHQLPQIRDRREAVRHDLLRILVAQAVEREGAALGDRHGFSKQLGPVEPREDLASAQMPLAVWKERVAGLRDGCLQPDRGEHIL